MAEAEGRRQSRLQDDTQAGRSSRKPLECKRASRFRHPRPWWKRSTAGLEPTEGAAAQPGGQPGILTTNDGAGPPAIPLLYGPCSCLSGRGPLGQQRTRVGAASRRGLGTTVHKESQEPVLLVGVTNQPGT